MGGAGGAGVGPGGEGVDFFLGEGTVVAEGVRGGGGVPGGHFAGDDGGADGAGPGSGLLVCCKGHGGDFAGGVAGGAAGLEDGLDLLPGGGGGEDL